jgi:hypothetical protein
MRSFSQRKEYAASTGGISLLVGANAALTLSFAGTSGGGLWSLSGSPSPDPMDVDSFAATLMGEASCVPILGVQMFLGRLTGQQAGDAVQWLKTGILGSGGELWLRAPYPFRTEYGLAVYVPQALTSGNYVILAEGGRSG